jgi:hypothetical protein
VVKAGQDPSLGQEECDVFRPGEPVAVRHLDGDPPLEVVIPGQVDPSEAPFAQDPLHAVTADPLRHG